MGKKKRKKKKLTLKQLKEKVDNFNKDVVKGKKIGFEMLQRTKPKVENMKQKQTRKEKKHKKDWRYHDV